MEHPPTIREGVELTLLGYEVLQDVELITLPKLHPKNTLAPWKTHCWEQPTERSRQRCSSGEPPPSEASKPPTPRITALSSLCSTAWWWEPPRQVRVATQGEHTHKRSCGDLSFPLGGHFCHTTSAPRPLTFMPRTVGLPVIRPQVHRPRGFDQQMLDIPPGEQWAATTHGSWDGSAASSISSSSSDHHWVKKNPKPSFLLQKSMNR